jgi:hypothetical protein
MATFNPALLADIGKFTKASDYNNLKDNVEWLQEKADDSHDFDPDTGTGHHRGTWSAPTIFETTASGGRFAAVWIDNSTATKRLRVKFGASAAAATPSSEDDATSFIFVLGTTGSGPAF